MKKSDTAVPEYLFHQGTNYQAYEYLGCHEKKGKSGWIYTFRTWAPGARSVSLVGDFCGWGEGIPMRRVSERGIWELSLPSEESLAGQVYKYRIVSHAGIHLKGDPYAVFSRGKDDGASIITHKSRFRWKDDGWLRYRRETVTSREHVYLAAPVNIYEVHLGSFMLHEDGSHLTYHELGDELAAYCKSMGYTHVELLPVCEHPYDRSWGYQVCGFFAPTSRFGTPDDFRYFVNRLHTAGVGVILDWVPAHFPKDEWGLYEFDGSPLYEYQGKDRQESRSWGTRFFDLGREEIQSFLISSATYWLKEFHIDGLRVDAVASMLYLDYDREPGEWFPNKYGDNKNLEAIAFFRKLNAHLFGVFPDILMIAEESTSWGGITHPVSEGGLGFNLKWNMGWANDFFDYLSIDPAFRHDHHTALNFPLTYAFSENYILPISHDEVVYGKKSLFNKPFGSYEDKIKQFRTALLLQMTYPGKKLLFMGTEFGQFSEWNDASSVEWFMLDYPVHAQLREYTAALNRFYLGHPELWEQDFIPAGFTWIYPDAADADMVAFCRHAIDGEKLIVVMTFSGAPVTGIRIPLAPGQRCEVVFETDGTGEPRAPLNVCEDEDGTYVILDLAPMSGVILKPEKDTIGLISLANKTSGGTYVS